MRAMDALTRLSRNIDFDNEGLTDEDKDYLRTIIRALSALADAEQTQK